MYRFICIFFETKDKGKYFAFIKITKCYFNVNVSPH